MLDVHDRIHRQVSEATNYQTGCAGGCAGTTTRSTPPPSQHHSSAGGSAGRTSETTTIGDHVPGSDHDFDLTCAEYAELNLPMPMDCRNPDDYLRPPASADWGTECPSSIFGSEMSCRWRALDITRSPEWFEDLTQRRSLQEHGQHVHFNFSMPGGRHEGLTSGDPIGEGYQGRGWLTVPGGLDAERAMLTAWALLRTNQDLIDWAICWVTGDTSTRRNADCILRLLTKQLHEDKFGIIIQNCHKDNAAGVTRWLDRAGRPQINICIGWTKHNNDVQDPTFSVVTDMFSTDAGQGPRNPLSSASTLTINRMCGAIALAGLILHEMVHICRLPEHHDSLHFPSRPAPCASTYMIQRAFLWAMYRRYPASMLSLCCTTTEYQLGFTDTSIGPYARPRVDDAMFASGGGTQISKPNRTCI